MAGQPSRFWHTLGVILRWNQLTYLHQGSLPFVWQADVTVISQVHTWSQWYDESEFRILIKVFNFIQRTDAPGSSLASSRASDRLRPGVDYCIFNDNTLAKSCAPLLRRGLFQGENRGCSSFLNPAAARCLALPSVRVQVDNQTDLVVIAGLSFDFQSLFPSFL